MLPATNKSKCPNVRRLRAKNKIFMTFLPWLCLSVLFVSLLFWAGSLSVLMRIKKIEFSYLWEKDKSKETFWRSSERILADELIFKTPFWIYEIKNARFWLWIYRCAVISFIASGILGVALGSNL